MPADDTVADLERRFGGLRRLYGDTAYERIRRASVVVVGVGGVGSWIAEGLARSGVGRLTLVDLDQVSESNINRQVQALGATVGQAKVVAMTERLRDIHPGCELHGVEEFVDADNWPGLLPAGRIDVVVDACDQVRAKAVLATWALATRRGHVIVGAAGGKRRPEAVEVDDLARVSHDPLLASLRQRLRQTGAAPRGGAPIGLRCVYSREAVSMPAAPAPDACAVDGSLNCHGYGSSVAVTATFGMVALSLALDAVAGTALPDGPETTL